MPRQQRVNHDISIGKTGPAANWTGETGIGAPVCSVAARMYFLPQARKHANSAAPSLFSRPGGWVGPNGGKIGAGTCGDCNRDRPAAPSRVSERRIAKDTVPLRHSLLADHIFG